MITFHELLIVVFILTSVSLFFFFYHLERIRTDYFYFVSSILISGILIGITELAISLKFWALAELLFPLYLALLFIIYPLFYLYTRNLVFTKNELKGKSTYIYYSVVVAVFISSLIFYLPLSPEEKQQALVWETEAVNPTSLFGEYLLWTSVIYYIHFLVFLFLFIRLLLAARKNMSDRLIDKNIVVSWLKYFIITLIIYEAATILALAIFDYEVYQIAVQFIGLIFLLFLGLLRINQLTIQIQTRLRHAKVNMEITDEKTPKYLMTGEEKQELMTMMRNAITEKKLFQDPNLTVDQFAKLLHVPAKKLSVVINEITESSFSHFLNSYRIQKAKDILQEADEKTLIEDIYLKTGFNSRSTFNRVFKSYTGVTPKEFRSGIK